jgi:hypothetical protein
MGIGKLAVLAVAVAIAFGGVGAALADWRGADPGPAIEVAGVDARKSEVDDDIAFVEDDDDQGDGDKTRGNDGTSGGNNTGDGDRTRGNDGTSGGNNTGDGDQTGGNDGTGGGNNTGGAFVPSGGDDTGGGGGGTGGGTTG